MVIINSVMLVKITTAEMVIMKLTSVINHMPGSQEGSKEIMLDRKPMFKRRVARICTTSQFQTGSRETVRWEAQFLP
jgi:hypothetical protein